MSNRGMVVCPQPEAAEAGIEILRAGGNAVDAAIGCGLAQTVVDPLMCGIAGFGSLAVYKPAEGVHEYLDFHAPAPRSARPDMWADLVEGETRDGFGFVLKGRVNDLGYQSICVPASLQAYETAHRAHGRLSWEAVCEPAIRWAEEGYFVRPAMYSFWLDEGTMGRASSADRLAYSASGRAMYCRPDGTPKRIGAPLRNPDYAATLRRIAEEGADVFYRGEIADRIVADMAAHGGLITKADLESYQPNRVVPLDGTYRGRRIATNQPPGGGIMLLEMLNILEQFDLGALGHNTPEFIRVVCETMKRATVDKDRLVGDPAFVDIPIDRLTSKEYAAELADDIRHGVKAEVPRLQPTDLVPKDTTHVSVVDADGNCVSMTHSLGMPSGVITDGLGFMYNGCMGVFDPRPGRAGSIAPGKARFSAMCPTIVFEDGKPLLVLGAPGGTQIVMGVLQAILNVIDFGMTMGEAVGAPRFSSTSNAIDVSNRIPRYLMRELEAQGYEVIRNPFGHTIGWVHGIRILPDRLDGAADPGRDGVALSAG
ncbi:gamma-glutamyltransferase [Thalassobaculum sp.]|uniref:gamma-glutamyltransferase n=1 Tax=Thalassobaculum sp. TaxID=2022740 RepID=UPI0032EBF4C8